MWEDISVVHCSHVLEMTTVATCSQGGRSGNWSPKGHSLASTASHSNKWY